MKKNKNDYSAKMKYLKEPICLNQDFTTHVLINKITISRYLAASEVASIPSIDRLYYQKKHKKRVFILKTIKISSIRLCEFEESRK